MGCGGCPIFLKGAMRIFSVSNCPLDPNQGSGYVITGYASRQRSLGHDLVAVGPADYEWWPRLRAAKRLRMLLGYTTGVLRALRRERFDVVELWGAESWWVASRLARRASRPLLVARSNGLETHVMEKMPAAMEQRSVPGRMLDRWQDIGAAFRSADLLTTVSEFDRRYALTQAYQPHERILAIENPLHDAWLDAPVADEKPPLLGYFGSWLPRKGNDIIAEILPAVLRAHPAWRVRLVGVGMLDRDRTFPADVAGRIEIVPSVSDRDRLRAMYDETAVVMMPSRYESFGMVAAEAMARGCALIAAPTGIAADVRSEIEAVVVPNPAAADWSRALSELLADTPRQRRIASGGRRRVQALRWNPAVGRLMAAYEQLRPKAA